ncbi:MAG TPA: winged helix-turn-helix domain-containing protein [Caulobacteraceae bacterium]|jgi:DNA-binding transcriptional ArsR family regulator|nr:winged helix-turn-helix domain-containing protein [Caulobacteraceae bacterium]
MTDAPSLAELAALIADPSRAAILLTLMDGRALTASELASAAGVGLPTASTHLGRLVEAGLVAGEKQGRHRYHRLAGPEVAEAIEALLALCAPAGPAAVRTGPHDAAMREARVCYDHLAGVKGVALLDALRRRGFIQGEDRPELTDAGRAAFQALGVELSALAKGRRPLCRGCLDWSERRTHLGGALGAAILSLMLERGWARRLEGRALEITPSGERAMAETFGVAA